MAQRRDEVDQIASSDHYPCLFLLGEVVHVFLEGLEVGRVGCSEPASEDVVASAQCLSDIASVAYVQNRL